MRKIELSEPETRRWKRWCSDCKKAKDQLTADVAAGKAISINERLYKRKSIKDSWFFGRGEPFFGKCAYCEAPIPDYQHGDVEHFRPKAGVTDAEDRPIPLLDGAGEAMHDDEGRPRYHPGYYWLAYDWRNLLPACTKCNQPNVIGDQKIGKHNRFPVAGRHARTSEEIAGEEPLLIHPASGREEDDPDRHLVIDTATGIMGHRTERGRTSIAIFGLNLRDQLVSDRRRACREAQSLLVRILVTPGGDVDAARELAEIQAGKRSFTMAQRAMLRESEARLRPVFSDDG